MQVGACAPHLPPAAAAPLPSLTPPPLPLQELPRFQELIFEDFARFILVENTYEEVVLQTVMKDILQGTGGSAAGLGGGILTVWGDGNRAAKGSSWSHRLSCKENHEA